MTKSNIAATRQEVEADLRQLAGIAVYKYCGGDQRGTQPVQVVVERTKGGKRPAWLVEFSWDDGLTQAVKYSMITRLADVIVLFTKGEAGNEY